MIKLPIIDVSPLLNENSDDESIQKVANAIDEACRSIGFFCISNHGIPRSQLDELESLSRQFFDLPNEEKEKIAMVKAQSAWRGWFPLHGELTSGKPDGKEGIYFGIEHKDTHPEVIKKTPLHGKNLFPENPIGFKTSVLKWLDSLIPLAQAVLKGIAIGLKLDSNYFQNHLVSDPTVLFRIFFYPPNDSSEWGVAEHTDYGLLTLLAQDDCGGLQVKTGDQWIDVPPNKDVFVCNIGDMLDRLTEGRYRSTAHRVKNISNRKRLSFPLFFDPSWTCVVPKLPLDETPPSDNVNNRWDGSSVLAWNGTYGNYLTEKVKKVFPELFDSLEKEERKE